MDAHHFHDLADNYVAARNIVYSAVPYLHWNHEMLVELSRISRFLETFEERIFGARRPVEIFRLEGDVRGTVLHAVDTMAETMVEFDVEAFWEITETLGTARRFFSTITGEDSIA